MIESIYVSMDIYIKGLTYSSSILHYFTQSVVFQSAQNTPLDGEFHSCFNNQMV